MWNGVLTTQLCIVKSVGTYSAGAQCHAIKYATNDECYTATCYCTAGETLAVSKLTVTFSTLSSTFAGTAAMRVDVKFNYSAWL